MNKKVYVHVDGCDDSTQFTLTISDEQREFLAALERITAAHGVGCKPVIEVRETPGKYYRDEDFADGDEAVNMAVVPGE